MSLTTAQLQAYLLRIGYHGTADADLATLQQLHALHPLRIPFENLNSWTGNPVSLHPDQVFEKLVTQQRGGYCFEQNQLFMRVLQSLGLTVLGLSARVLWMLPENIQQPRTHMVLLVTLAGKQYLTDVGFGGLTMTAALDLDNTDVQPTSHEPLRIEQHAGLYVLSAFVNHTWQNLYCFTLDPQQLVDYETANWYVSTHPQSRFVNQLIVARPDTNGRHTLLDRRYTRYLPDTAPSTMDLKNVAEFMTVLQQQFLLQPDALAGLQARVQNLFTNQD